MSKDTTNTVIEITDAHIKVVQLRSLRGKSAVSFSQIKPIETSSDEDITEIIKGIVSAKNFRAKNVIGVIPRRFAILKHITLPSQTEDEIEKMIDLQVVNNVPYSREDVVYDSSVIDKDQSGYTRILVTIVHKQVINRYLKIFNNAGVSLGKLTVSSQGLVEWFNYQLDKGKFGISEPVVLINLDHVSCEICFFHNKKLIFSRNLNYGARSLTEEKVPAFIKQFQLTLATYVQDKMGPSSDKVIIISGVQEAFLLKDKLLNESNMTIEVLSSLNAVPIQKSVKTKLQEQGGIDFSVGLGFLLAKQSSLSNFMTDEHQNINVSKERRRQVVRLVSIACIFVFLGLFALFYDFYQDSMYLKTIRNENSKIKTQVEKAQNKIKVFSKVNDAKRERILVSELFLELYNLTPQEVAFRAVNFNESRQLTIQGYGQLGASINEFQNNLVNSNMFENVNLEYSRKLKMFNEELTDFKISCSLSQRK